MKTEVDVIEIIKKEICVDKLDLAQEGQWDSLDLVQVLMALDDAFDNKLKDVRELQTVKNPQQIIDVLRAGGFIS